MKQEEIRKRIPSLEQVKDIPILRAYRDFYWKVGTDPTKTRPAGEGPDPEDTGRQGPANREYSRRFVQPRIG